jgi:hypothetical protein
MDIGILLERFKNGESMAGKKLRHEVKPIINKVIRDALISKRRSDSDFTHVDLRLIVSKELNYILISYKPEKSDFRTYIEENIRNLIENITFEISPGLSISNANLVKMEVVEEASKEAHLEYGDNITIDQISEFLPEHSEIKNDLEEIERMIKIKKMETERHITCSKCIGNGEINCSNCYGSGNGIYGGQCEKCIGAGAIICRICDGKGYIYIGG